MTLGQDGKRYDVRLRTTSTSTNGIPSTASPDAAVQTRLTHVVYTRDRAGNARVYIDGKQGASRKIAGDCSNWNDNFRLVLANESTGDRPWLGELHLVAIYGRPLTPREVEQNHEAGSGAQAAPAVAQDRNKANFETRIAPLLAQKLPRLPRSRLQEGGPGPV